MFAYKMARLDQAVPADNAFTHRPLSHQAAIGT